MDPSLWAVAIAGLFVGFVVGLTGMGGGALMTPMMILLFGVQPLAARLKANGFSTGAFVAAFPLDARFGLTPGFDTYDGRFDDVGSGAEFLLPERPAPVVVERAVQWIQQRDGRWFAWVHVYDPHAPYDPPPGVAVHTTSRYDAEIKTTRPEYLDHKPVLDEFLTRARANRK